MLINWYRFANFLYRHHLRVIPKICWKLQYLLFNCSVPPSCIIGKGSVFGYGGIGVVIPSRTVIGKNCMIGQNVTIGGKSGWYEVPVIGDNVHISAGACVLGPIKIGNNVIIGANTVVVKDVPNNCIVAGIPAKIIKENISLADFEGETSFKKRGDAGWPITPKI